MNSLDLALIGTGTVSALITPATDITWACFARFDGDPVFYPLLMGDDAPDGIGNFVIELLDQARSEQSFVGNTPVLVTRLFDTAGGIIEIVNFAPRFQQNSRFFCPMWLVRRMTVLVQHDFYGATILAATHIFFDQRLEQRADLALFERLERIGARPAAYYDQPDARIWQLRGSTHVHTVRAVMCWAGCDRLARIAPELGLRDRHAHWRATADGMHVEICRRC